MNHIKINKFYFDQNGNLIPTWLSYLDYCKLWN